MKNLLILLVVGLAVGGCATIRPRSSNSDSGVVQQNDAGTSDDSSVVQNDSGTTAHDSGVHDSGTHDSGSGPTWTALYTNYFGPGTAGHCGSSGCHSSTRGGFRCGGDKTTCYNGFVASGYVNTGSSASSSPLADPSQTCLGWYGTGGNMPQDNPSTDNTAAAAVTAWVQAGALNN